MIVNYQIMRWAKWFFRIIGILSDATGHLHFKCPKCKSSVAVNLSYFRRTRRIYRKQNKIQIFFI